MFQLEPLPEQIKRWSQYHTPEWVAQELVERYFSDLYSGDLVLEPACGTGAFLKALPPGVPAVGG